MADIKLTTTATIPTNTSITVTVNEDVDGDGAANNTASQAIGNGTNTYTLSGFDSSEGNDYWLQIEPDTTNNETGASWGSVAVEVTPNAPSNLSATYNSRAIDLSWTDNSAIEDGFNIYRATASNPTFPGDYTLIDSVAADTTTYSDTTVAENTSYTYRVTATNSGLESAASNEASESTPALFKPTGLTATAASETSVDLSWTDHSTRNDGQRVLREREYDGAWGPSKTVADLGPDVQTHTDDTVHPGRRYRYRIEAYTSGGDTATSSPATVTTTSLGVPQTQSRRQDWTVEIVASTGEVHRPELAGTPQWQPAVTAMPRLHLPVSDRPRWHRDDLLTSDATEVRVWYRGHQLAIDSVVRSEPEPGQVTLVCQGASQLDVHVPSEQVDEQETHLWLRDVIPKYTNYTVNIDDPDSSTRSDVVMLDESMSRPESFRDSLAIDFDPDNPGHPVDDTIPIRAVNDGLKMKQTSFPKEAENGTYSGVEFIGSELSGYNGEWSEGNTIQINEVGEYVEVSASFNHTVPAGDLQAKFLMAFDGGYGPALDFKYNGSVVDSAALGAFSQDADEFDTDYYTVTLNSGSSHTDTATVRVEVTDTDASSGDVYVDLIPIYDNRFSYTFEEDFTDESATGPELYPASYSVETVDTSSVEQVIGGRLTVSIDDTSTNQGLGLSNDQGVSWKRGSNTADFSAAFDSADQQIRGEITISRYGSQSTTPTQGIDTQVVDQYTVYADLDDTPVLLDRHFSGDLVEVLQKAAESGDFVLEPRRDPAAAWDDPAGIIVEGTVAGQRTRSRVSEDVVEFSAATTVEQSYDKIVVSGASKNVRGEAFTTGDPVDTKIGLDESWIVPGTERIVDPSDGTEFTRGTDYVMDWQEGAITPTSGGSMQANTTYEADYRFKFRGSASSSGVTDPRTREVRIPTAASDRECEQLALSILKRVQEPLEQAEVTVATDDPSVSLIEALSHPEIPLDGPLVVRESKFSAGEVRYQLGTRQSFADVVEEIRSQFQAIAKRI